MITAIVRFPLDEPLSPEAATERFLASAPRYQKIDGLERKHYLRTPDGSVAGGIYFWEGREAAEALYTDEWKRDLESRFGAAPTVEFFQIPVSVEPDAILTPRSAWVSRSIAAPADTVFAAISDITRMGEWSPETVATEWLDGHDKPAVGARYVGHNRHSDKEWSIEAEIVELVDNERFSFDCHSPTSGQVYARWGYVIAPTEGGCTVTQWTEDLRSERSKARSDAALGITDRIGHNRRGMAETLRRLASVCEAG